MDPRITEHAGVLVDWSVRIGHGDNVVLNVSDGAHSLAVAVATEIRKRGANLVTTYDSDKVHRAYMCGHDGDFDENPTHAQALLSNADVSLHLMGGRNTSATEDVPGDRQRSYARATAGIREERMRTDWVSTVHPTRSLSKRACRSNRIRNSSTVRRSVIGNRWATRWNG